MGEVRTFSVADVITLFGMVSAAILGGVGAAMGWFKSSNKLRDERITKLEAKVEDYKDLVMEQASSLQVLKACQTTIQENLADIKADIKDTAIKGASSVNTQIAFMINELQQLSADIKRSKHT